MKHPLVALVGFVAAGALYGSATSAIPAPQEVDLFWVGNFCAPWLVLPFLAGWAQRSWSWAAVTGVLADLACVTGFYAKFLTLDPLRLGLDPATSALTVATTSVRDWVAFTAVWLIAAVLAGSLYGVLGHWWGRSRALPAGLAVGAGFIVEPWLWPVYEGMFKGPMVLWVGETLVGLAVIAWVVVVWRRRRTPTPPEPAPDPVATSPV